MGRRGRVVFLDDLIAGVTVNAAAGSVDDPFDAGLARCLHDVVGQVGAFPKVDIGLGDRLADVGIGGEVIDDVDACRRLGQFGQILDVLP